MIAVITLLCNPSDDRAKAEVGNRWLPTISKGRRDKSDQTLVACDHTRSPNIAAVAQVQRLPACSKAIGLWGMLDESRHVWGWPSPHFINIHKLWEEGRTGGDPSLVAGLVLSILNWTFVEFFLYHWCRKPSRNYSCKRHISDSKVVRSLIVEIEGEPPLQICLCALFHQINRSQKNPEHLNSNFQSL